MIQELPAWLKNLLRAGTPFITVLVILLTWEIVARLEVVIPFLLPRFSTVIMRIGEDVIFGGLLVDLGLTIYRTLAAFAICAIAGVTLGIMMSRTAWVRWFFDPIVSVGLPLPKIALLPIFMLWFGLYDMSKIFLAAFSAVFAVVIAAMSGTESVNRQIIWSARNLGASKRQLLWQIILPAAMPQIFTGLQVAMPLCLIVIIVGEMVMGGRGIGEVMVMSARYADSTGVYAGIIEISICGFAVNKGMEVARGWLLSWHPEEMKNNEA